MDDNNMKPSISFDEEGKVRVLEQDKFKQTEELQTQCREFVSSKSQAVSLVAFLAHLILLHPSLIVCWTEISDFSEGVSTVVEVLNAQAKQIEQAKLKVSNWLHTMIFRATTEFAYINPMRVC